MVALENGRRPASRTLVNYEISRTMQKFGADVPVVPVTGEKCGRGRSGVVSSAN